MSTPSAPSAKTIPAFRARKGGEKLVCLTASTLPMAGLLAPHCDLLLVGDSLAMVLYGLETTLSMDLDTMIRHGQAVRRGAPDLPVILDMPFGSYQESPEQAFRNAARALAESGCDGVKIEGGSEMAETVAFLTRRGVPVMGHIGLLPQHVKAAGGYRVQGRDTAQADSILEDAQRLAQSGVFALVVEAVPESLGAEITRTCPVPVIGIGASGACDGQILVSEDMLGLSQGRTPRFVDRYADLAGVIGEAAARYAGDVRAERFPRKENLYV